MALAMVIPPGLMEASVTRSFYCWRNQRRREVSAVTTDRHAESRRAARCLLLQESHNALTSASLHWRAIRRPRSQTPAGRLSIHPGLPRSDSAACDTYL